MVRLRPFIRALRPTVYLIERWRSPSRWTHLPPLIVYTIPLKMSRFLAKNLQNEKKFNKKKAHRKEVPATKCLRI